MFSKNTFLNSFLITFIFSILVNNYLQDFFLTVIIFLIFCFIFVISQLYKNNIISILLLLIFIILGNLSGIYISQTNIEKIKNNENYTEKNFLRKENYELKVLQLYKKYDFYNTYIVQIHKIGVDIVDKKIGGLVYIPSNLTLEKGQLIYTNSQILIIDNIDNFSSYKKYLLSKNIYFKSYLYNFDIISKDENILTKLDLFRSNILNTVNKIYPKESSILISGILLGARENIPQDLTKSFNNSGTTHIIAVSGFNITILIIFLGFGFKYFPIYIRTIIIISFLILFCLFVGLEASVVRAGIMGIIGYIITLSGRKSKSITLLLITAFLMILYNPYYISYDISFQLSFLAVIGILYTKDYLENIFYFLPNTLSIKESFVLSLAAMVFTLPISMFNFGQISLLTPISNIAIIWSIPLIMFIGFLSIIGFYIIPILGKFIGFFSYILLSWDLFVIKLFGSLNSFIIKTDFGDYTLYLEVFYFIIIGFIIIIKKNNFKES